MSKPYTESDLSIIFDRDLIWRRKEMSDIKAAIIAADQYSRPALLRSLVAITYAHWEGYVRLCSQNFFLFITLRKKSFSDLERQFYTNSFLARLDALFQSRSSIKTRCELIGEILDGGENRFAYIDSKLVDTRSNLNTDVVTDICLICGVDPAFFEANRNFIDIFLLKRRNSIAHGQQEFINLEEVDTLVEGALAIMGHFRDLLENKVVTKSYLAA